MRGRTRWVALPMALVLGVSLLGGSAWSATTPGTSTPVEDSYYPAHGDPGIDVLRYDLDLKWRRKTQTLRGTATIQARATAGSTSLTLALANPLTVSKVTVNGSTAKVTRLNGRIAISKTSGVFDADSVSTITIDYHGQPRPVKAPTQRADLTKVGWHTTPGGNAWTMQEPFGAFTWYPVNDTPSDKAMYRVRIDVPPRQVGVFNGRMRRISTTNGRKVTLFRPGHPIASYLTTIAIAPMKRVRSKAWDGTPITIWLPKAHPEYARLFDKTARDFRWLVRTLGPYPFDRVGIVVVPSASAMETQEMVTFGQKNLKHGKRTVRAIVAHELAHSWFGDTATPTDWRDVWMNEGFAMYYQAKFEVHRGWSTWASNVRLWKQWGQYLRDRYGPPGAYHRDAFASSNVYYCPARMLDRLSTKVGPKKYSRLVRRWVATHTDANVSREEFQAWWENRTGLDLTNFLDRWLNSPTAPR